MSVALTIGAVVGLVVWTAWLNGAFLRCPHCGRRASLRDDGSAAVEQRDEDGFVVESTRVRVCRKCGKRVVDQWSDMGGRSLGKADEGGRAAFQPPSE